MGLVFSKSNFFINKISQGRKSNRKKITFLHTFAFIIKIILGHYGCGKTELGVEAVKIKMAHHDEKNEDTEVYVVAFDERLTQLADQLEQKFSDVDRSKLNFCHFFNLVSQLTNSNDQGGKYLCFFSTCSLKTREKYISLAKLILYNF